MKNKFYALALLFFPFLLGPNHAEAQTPKTLLWEISGNGLENPSYIYGTMHVADKRAFKFRKSVMPSFESCKQFAMELNPDEADPMALLNKMKLDSGKLEDLFSQEEWTKLDNYFQEKYKTSVSAFNEFTPFYVYALMVQSSFKKEMGEALDLYFFKKAKNAGKNLHGLETVDEQLEAINSMPFDDQKKMLLDALDDNGDGASDVKKMLKYYMKGDLDMLESLADEADYGNEFENALIVDRNHLMAERLQPLIKESATFIAVGALHLPGDEGILALLRKDGYSVNPILK